MLIKTLAVAYDLCKTSIFEAPEEVIRTAIQDLINGKSWEEAKGFIGPSIGDSNDVNPDIADEMFMRELAADYWIELSIPDSFEFALEEKD
jgi:hypothetical protein